MPSELWDLHKMQLAIAVAMWRHEAERVQHWTTAKRRTKSAFLDSADENQARWMGFAAVAMEHFLNPPSKHEADK
jgi:hypothetical protein